jgi:hypothetical protein
MKADFLLLYVQCTGKETINQYKLLRMINCFLNFCLVLLKCVQTRSSETRVLRHRMSSQMTVAHSTKSFRRVRYTH